MRKQVWERSWILRPAGACLLAAAYLIARHLAAIGPHYAGHEPPIVYLWALIAFMCGSAGAASLVHGAHLFDQVERSHRWISRAPSATQQSEWSSDLDRTRRP